MQMAPHRASEGRVEQVLTVMNTFSGTQSRPSEMMADDWNLCPRGTNHRFSRRQQLVKVHWTQRSPRVAGRCEQLQQQWKMTSRILC